jgi:flagellar motor switch protein FliN/FliY
MSQTTDEQQVSEDDWAAAMNEQTATAPQAAAPQPAQIFEQFSEGAPSGAAPRGFDMIMDIPVSLTVELGRCNWPMVRWSSSKVLPANPWMS